jgi:hypothetical protein
MAVETETAPAPGADFFHWFANALADAVETDLKERKIPLLVSEEPVTPARHIDRNHAGTPGVYQVTLLEAWPNTAAQLPAKEFVYKYLRRWAINIGLKLARTGVLTTYPMPMPKMVEAKAQGRSENLVLRCLLDYSMHDDLKLLRIDALASWDE